LRYKDGRSFAASAEALGGIVVEYPGGTIDAYAGHDFYVLRLAAPKPKLVEVRIPKAHIHSFYIGSDIQRLLDKNPAVQWRTFYNLDTGEVIPRVGVEE